MTKKALMLKNKLWIVEKDNSLHNGFLNLFTSYDMKV
jgi:hypothetical protein